MKRLLISLIAVLLVLALCTPVWAVDDPIYIEDNANLLSTDERELLQSRAEQITNNQEIAVYIITVPTTHAMTTREFADNYYVSGNLGYGKENSGILLLIAMDSPTGRGWSIVTYAEGYDALSDDRSESLMEDVTPLLSVGQYSNAFELYFNLIEEEIIDFRVTTPDEILFFVIIALAIGALIGLITILIMRAGMKTAVFQRSAKEYVVNGSYDLKNRQDIFLYSHVTKVRKSSNSSSGRGGSGRSGGSSGNF